jgi:hypothetical protein
MSEEDRRAHRLAGRAVAAVLVGAYVEGVSLEDGITIATEAEDPSIKRSGTDILSEIFFVLMGVAAKQAYSFGFPPGDAVLLMPRPDDPLGLDDIELADELSLELAEANCSRLAMVWRYASELVCQPDICEAIEVVAGALFDRNLDHSDVMRLCLGERRGAVGPR